MINSKKTILLVDDDPIVLAAYRGRLQREGFHVEGAGDGLAALEALAQIKPSMVILDLMLPMLDGLDVLKFIRDDANLKTTPVLILSNAYLSERAVKVMQAGANKGLLKTECTPAKLVEAVRELLAGDPGDRPQLAGGNHPEGAAAQAKADEASLNKARAELLKEAPAKVAKIREHCLVYVKTVGSPENFGHLNKFYQHVRFLCARASLNDCSKVAHLASALEAMLFEIIFKSATPSASALQTIAQSVDCLGRLFQNGDVNSPGATLKAKVLVVDDDPICNFAAVAALKRARLDPVSTQDPHAALKMAEATQHDIVLLDIVMPEMSGFEVCKKLRLLPHYQTTPIIFVTSNGEFQNRAQGILSGGDHLIAKPISPLELALKVIMHLIEPHKPAAGATTRAAAALPVPVPEMVAPALQMQASWQ